MRLVLTLVLLVVPLLEVLVLIQAGEVFGGWQVVAALVAVSLLGAYVIRREGLATWRALRDSLGSGQVPSRELADTALVLVGGTLLLTPGFLSDAVGLLLILPLTRPVARRLVFWLLAGRFPLLAMMGGVAPRTQAGGSRTAGSRRLGGMRSARPRPGAQGGWAPGKGSPGSWAPGKGSPGRGAPGSGAGSKVVPGEVVDDEPGEGPRSS